jgi:hypothetical protein
MPGPKNPAAAGGDGDQFRVGHADREQVIETLKNAFVQGRLTKDELDARATRALHARTRAELDALIADVPASWPAAPVTKPAAARRRRPAPARPRRSLVRATAGASACMASAFGLILFAASYLDPHGLGNPYHPWSTLCVALAFALALAAVLIATAGAAAAVEQKDSRM